VNLTFGLSDWRVSYQVGVAVDAGPHFTAPLTAITAAVVGVIASLALFFLAHIALRADTGGPWLARVDFYALAITLGAAVALLRYKRGVIPVIAASALAGLLLRLSGLA
jgi:chromate transporter